jgi:hypothetical protein
MFDHEPKKMVRKDAVYNPIEGKWEKCSIRSTDYDDLYGSQDKLNVESVKSAINNIGKKAAKGLSSNPTEPSSNLIKKLINIPWKKLQYIKSQQDLHDRKVYNGSEADYKVAKNKEIELIIKVAIALILLFFAVRT